MACTHYISLPFTEIEFDY